jgi:carbon storage regulator
VLVLSRRAGESVVIGNDVVVTVLEVRGDVVRVGIAAPREVAVHREEVFKELQAANQSAASPEQAAVDALAATLGRATRPAPGSELPG